MGTTRWHRLQLLTLALLAAAPGGCSRVDVSHPIALRPAADIAASIVSDLGDAADCWKLEVGTQLAVVPAGSPATPGPQVTRIWSAASAAR